jgi:hypothetical protein
MGQLLCLRTAWDQLVLNHANSKNIVFQRFAGFFDTPCIAVEMSADAHERFAWRYRRFKALLN